MAQQSHFGYVAQDYFSDLSVVTRARRSERPVCQDYTFSSVHQTGLGRRSFEPADPTSHRRLLRCNTREKALRILARGELFDEIVPMGFPVIRFPLRE